VKFNIFYKRSGRTLIYDSELQKGLSLLDLAFDNQLNPKAGCRSGYCGACQSAILSGEVKYFYDPPPLPADDGAILLCSAYPVSDLTLDC